MSLFDEVLTKGTTVEKVQPLQTPSFDELISGSKTETAPSFADVMSGKGSGKREHITFFTADQVNDWMTASSELGKKAGEYYGKGEWVSPDTQLIADIDAKLNEAPKVRQYFVANSSALENPDEAIAQVDKFIEDLTALRDGGKSANEVFGQFDSAEEFNSAVTQSEYNGKDLWELESLKESHDVLFTTEDGTDVTGEMYYNTRVYLATVDKYDKMSADDIARIKKEMPGGETGIAYTTPDGQNITLEQLYESKKWEEEFEALYSELSARDDWDLALDSAYGSVIKWSPTGGVTSLNEAKLDSENRKVTSEISLEEPKDPLADDKVLMEFSQNPIYREMTNRERQIFKYYFNTEGAERARLWLGHLEEKLKERELLNTAQMSKEYANKYPILSSVSSVEFNIASGVEYIYDALNYISTGEMDKNTMSTISTTIRNTVSDKYDWNIPALGGWDAFDFVYNTGMSMADSVATMPFAAIPGVGPWVSASVLGLSAAASATNEALERGLDDNHAFFTGVAAGAFETIFERVTIGEFKGLKEGITGGLKDGVKNVARSMLTNASEETLTEIANITYDLVANQDMSQYETSIRAKMAQGMSQEDAVREAATELGLQVAEAMGSGALMGFGFGAVGSASSYNNTSKTGKALNSEGLGTELVALGKTMDSGSAAQTFALELDGKQKVSNADVGKLFGLITEQAKDMTPEQIFSKAQQARAAQEGAASTQQTEAVEATAEPITPEEIAEAKRTTNMDITVEDAAEADASIDEDQAAFESRAYTEPPKAVYDENQITAYQDYTARKLSKELSRKVYMFNGSSEQGAQSAFVGKNGAIYINKNSPETKNALAIVAGHDYIHTLEGTDEYNDLLDAVLASATFKKILADNGMTKDQMVAAVQSRYAAAGQNLTTEATEREMVAQFVAEQLLQNLKALTEFAKTGCFAQFAVRIRRLLARMAGRIGKNADLVKIERLLQRAVRAAAKKPAATQSGEVRSSFMDSLNGMANDALIPYDEEMRGYIEKRGDFIVDSYTKLVEVVDYAFENPKVQATCYFGIIDTPMLQTIKKSIPNLPKNEVVFKDGKSYSVGVTLDSIRHIPDDKKGVTRKDVVDYLNRLADTILLFDTVAFDYYYHDNQRMPGLLFKKSFEDGVYISFNLVSQGKRSLMMQTLFMESGDYVKKKSAKAMPLQNSHGRTPEVNAGQTSTTIIHDSSEKSNKESKSSIPFGFSMGAAQTVPTRTSRFTRASVDEQAKQLMQNAGAKGDRAEFARILENFYEYVAQGQELSWDSITDATSPVVDWLTDHHATRNAVDDYAKDVLTEIRAVDMRLTDAQKAEAAAVYGSYGEYHRKAFGSVPFTKHASITLEERWRDLAEVYPEYFDPNENAANMPIRLLEIVGDLRKTNTAAEEYQRNLPEVRRDLAAAVYESYWGVSETRSERDRYEDRVYDLKEQHRAEMREERARGERAVAEERERGDVRVKQERQRAREREQRIKEQNRIQRERATDRQKRTEMREKIRKVVKELNSMLLKGNKDKKVMNGLREAVASALNAVQMTDAEGYEQGMQRRLAYYDQRLYEETDPKKIEQLQKERDDIVKRVDSMKTRLEHLSAAYADIMASNDASMQIYKHDAEMVKAKVETVMEIVGDTPLRHMNMRQLEAVHDLYKMVKTTVENANKIFKEGKAEELSKNAESIMDEVAELGDFEEKGYKETTKAREAFRNFTWSELKPIYAFRKLGSKTLMALYKELRRGEDVVARDVREAADFAAELREKYGWHEWDVKKTYTFKMPDGRTLPLTLPQMMSIYAYSKRPQAQKHIEQGGFVFSDKETFKDERGVFDVTRSSRESWRVNAWLLTEIAAKMNEIDKNCTAYVDEMQEFLSKVMGEKGNEVSRVMWGIDLFKEKHYFPLKSSHDFMFEQSKVNPTMALKSSGMTKRTTPHASNPIVLEGFDKVWAEHVVQMSNYHGFVIPIDNLNKVTNYAAYINEDHPQSVSTVIASVFGDSANKYIEKLLQDVNGGVKTEGTVAFFPKLIGNAKKTAVAASMSTVVQQPTAIVRATAMIDSKYFVGKPDTRKHGEKWEEVKAYAPVAILKEIGGFDTTSSRSLTDWLNQRHYQGVGAKAKALVTDSYYRDDKLMLAASKADEIGWITIWEAVKREQKGKSKLDPASEEFLQRCGERFTEVIEYTQVYDSTLARSGMMRSNDEYMKMATAFMGEPTTSFNMLLDAVTDAKRSGGKAALHAGRVVAAVYVSQALADAAAAAIYALRDDDEDEAYLDKWAEQFGKKLASDMWVHNMIPFVRDIASIADGWDVERMDMAIFADLYNAVTSLGSESKSALRKVEDLAGAIGALGGVPVRNIIRTVREVSNAVRFAFDDTMSDGIGDAFFEGFFSGWLGKAFDPVMKDEYDRTVEAIERGKGIPKEYRDDATVLTLMELYQEAEEQREKIENDRSMSAAEKKEALDDYALGTIVKSGELGGSWVDADGELVTDNKELSDEATDLLRNTYKSYLDLLIPSSEFQQASTAERIDMVGDVYDDVNTLFKETLKTMSSEQALNTFDEYQGKVSSGAYDPDVVSAFATVKLADGRPLVTNKVLCDRYESAVEEIYEHRMREAKGKYEWTKDGVKHTIYTASATAQEMAFIEEREHELARKDVARLFGDVDASTLASELAKWDAYTVKKKH